MMIAFGARGAAARTLPFRAGALRGCARLSAGFRFAGFCARFLWADFFLDAFFMRLIMRR
jgi:hypothetical protein